jgi:hypothetical protein
MALQEGHTAAVSQFINVILTADEKIVPTVAKLELLQAKNSNGTPGLCVALQNGHAACISQFITVILKADEKIVPSSAKLALLQAKDSDGIPGLYMALQEGHTAAVSQFINVILTADEKILPSSAKLGLLQAKSSDGFPGIGVVFLDGASGAAIKTYIELVLDTNQLSNTYKVKLLDNDKLVINLINQSTRLSTDEKNSILNRIQKPIQKDTILDEEKSVPLPQPDVPSNNNG